MHDDTSQPKYPPRFVTGDWNYDPDRDPEWDNPKEPRLRIIENEYDEIANAIFNRVDLVLDGHQVVQPDGSVSYCLLDFGKLHAAIERRMARIDDSELENNNTGASSGEGDEWWDGRKCSFVLKIYGCVIYTCQLSKKNISYQIDVSARFARTSLFGLATFNYNTNFSNSIFQGAVIFSGARFFGNASFNSCRYYGQAWFDGLRFECMATFAKAKFYDNAWFGQSHFLKGAWFRRAIFANSVWFSRSIFSEGVDFSGSNFAGRVGFHYASLSGDLKMHQVEICRECVVEFINVKFQGNADFYQSKLLGKMFFTGSSLDQRLMLSDLNISRCARLGFSRFLVRSGATIELARVLFLFDGRSADDSHGPMYGSPGWDSRIGNWLGLTRHPALIEGDDSNDSKSMGRAADDYELLAANYRNQPATDWEEDECRWRAHELRRLAKWAALSGDFKRFVASGPPDVSRFEALPTDVRWVLEYFWLMGDAAVNLLKHVGKAAWQIIVLWLISRTMVGYLLQPIRILISSGAILMLCALLYAVFASDTTMVMNAGPDVVPPWEDGLGTRLRFGAYFSLTTFVTLGYGDVAPTGWFKFVTGLQALFGVTLLALFTVAWGRKLVR